MNSQFGITRRCCRTNFPLRSKFAAERGVRLQTMTRHSSQLKSPLSVVSLVLIVACLISACGESTTITEYSLKKVDPKNNYGHDWMPLNPTIYRIGNNSVTSETAGILDKYDDCKTMSVENWECKYGSGSFGFKNGEFWRHPDWSDVKIVSRLEYNRVSCEWAYEDKYDGKFWGAVRCVMGWQ